MFPSIESFHGPRFLLLPLFALADDSPAEIHRYLELGEVLVARGATEIIGHIQLLNKGSHWDINSLAVEEAERGRGVGSLSSAFSRGASRMTVATAAADTGNLRFYQRLGFRVECVERGVFTPARAYPNLVIDGIPLRDGVWLSIDAISARNL